ncbi:MAG: SDR family NAD(P)-dependent oxidoreductase [Acidimicrobiia bacterium]
MRLEGKKALVTGAGRGIGRGVALALARQGAAVVVSDIDKDGGQAVAEEIGRAGGTAHFVAADVSRESDVQQMVAEAARALGGLNVLVNNAGIEIINPVTAITEEEWDKLMGINVKGTFFSCKHALPVIAEGGGGSVVNIASAAGIIGLPLLSLYCASKGAVVLFTKAIAQEYKEAGVRVNSICPMVIETEMGDRFINRYTDDFGIPIMDVLNLRQGRLGTIEEVAGAVTFLASDESSFVNGHALPLDNGGLSG